MAVMAGAENREILFLSALTADSGSGIRFWNMARQVAELGWPITFFERAAPDLPDRRHPAIRYRRSREGGPLAASLLRSWSGARRLAAAQPWRAVYALKPLPNSVLPALRARRRGARAVLDVDDLDFEYYPPGPARLAVKLFFRWAPRRFDAVSYHVAPLRDRLLADCGVPAERLVEIPQGIDIDLFQAPAQPLPEHLEAFLRSRRVIVYMASLGITSDFEDVLPLLGEQLRTHPDWGMLVLGHGLRLERFQELVGELGLAAAFHFAGYVNHELVPGILARCAAGFHYLRPGGANRYRAVMKIREYLAAGLPVAANASGDAAEFGPYIFLSEGLDGLPLAVEGAMGEGGPAQGQAGKRFVEVQLDWRRLAPRIAALLHLPHGP